MASMRAHSKTAVWTTNQWGAIRTLMPFLYQTRTLLPFGYFQKTKVQFAHYALAHTRRRIPDSSISVKSTNIPISRVGALSNANNRIHKPSHTYNGDIERSAGHNGYGDHWQGNAVTMDVKERGRAFVTENRGIPFDDGENFSDTIFSDEFDPFADEDMFNDNLEASETLHESAARPARESTITITERHAFERIFADIMARSKSVGAGMTPSSASSNNEPALLTKQSIRGRTAKEPFSRSPVEEETKTPYTHHGISFDSRLATKTPEELRADVDRYPIPLRAAAAKALGLVSARSAEPLKDEIISNANELENIRQPERERVESLMHDAKTDIELWQVMEAEVFALVQKLGLAEKSKVHAEGKKPRARRNSKQASETVKNDVPAPAGSDQPLDLNIYGPLYPSYVLLGLRLLDRSFAKPSPLVLNVLPRIKSLGIVSHVLGASTAFYNELLRIFWIRYEDFLAVSKLLNEMEQAGLEFDAETLDIVNQINQVQLKVRRGDRGSVLQALWTMPEFAPGKFRVWKEKIQASIEGRGTEGSDDTAWRT